MIDIFEVLDTGLMYCSVCTNITDKKRIEELTNNAVLQPFEKPWKLCSDVIFNNEESIRKSMSQAEFKISPPMLCLLIPYTHKHYTLQSFDIKHTYFKSPDIKKLYKYTPRIVVQEAPIDTKESNKRVPLDRRGFKGVSFLEVTKRGKLNLKLDSIVETKDAVKQRRKVLKKIDKKIKIVGKEGVFGIYIILEP